MQNKLKNVVNLDKLIEKAYNNKYALLHVNAANLEWTKAILETANETNSPIIVSVTEKSWNFMGGAMTFANIVDNLISDLKIRVPVVLHLDHGSYEGVKTALEVGFSSVMFDGSKLSFIDNKNKTNELLKLAQAKNASFEAEVGIVGGKEDGKDMGEGEQADPKECADFSHLPITCLAAGIGNIHGIYPANWKGLNFKRLEEISQCTRGMPLVLHGGSGIPNEQIKKAISLGVAKLNVNTECLVAFSDSLMKFYQKNAAQTTSSKWFDIRVSFADPIKAIKKIVKEKLELSGSINKA